MNGRKSTAVNPKTKQQIKEELLDLLEAFCTNIGNHFRDTENPIPDCALVKGVYKVQKPILTNNYSITFTVEIKVF